MIVKLTHAVETKDRRLEAGQIVEVETAEAELWIFNDWAFKFTEDVIEVTELSDAISNFIEAPKKKVKHV